MPIVNLTASEKETLELASSVYLGMLVKKLLPQGGYTTAELNEVVFADSLVNDVLANHGFIATPDISGT